MADAFTVYLVVLGALPIVFMAVYVYYELDTAAGRPLRKRGITQRGIAMSVILTLSTVLALGFLGTVDIFAPETNLRAIGLVAVVDSLLLGAGLLGLNASHTFARRWRRLHPDNDTPTGRLGHGEVACTGEITDAAVGQAPVTGRDAVCWSWTVEVVNPHGVGSQGDQFVAVDGGDGGVTFTLDDGSGPVRVDPGGATLDLGATWGRSFGAEEPPAFDPPAPTVERSHGDKPRRYEETIAAPGDRVAVAGTAQQTADGLVISGEETHIAVGTLSTVPERYRNKAAMYGLGGLIAVGTALQWLGSLFGVL